MKRYILALTVGLLSTTLSAAPSQEKIATLMDALGLVDMWSQQIELGKEQSQQLADQTLEQITAGLNPSEEFKDRFSQAFRDYMKAIESPWTPEQIVEVWARFYGPNFTDDELDQLIAFYTSDLGQKDIAATHSAMTQFSEYFASEFQPIMTAATQSFVNEAKLIAKECNCKHVAP